jgi:hypothetical protein
VTSTDFSANASNSTYLVHIYHTPGKWKAHHRRSDEVLMEIVRAGGVFLASCKHPDIPDKPEAIRRLVELGLKRSPLRL